MFAYIKGKLVHSTPLHVVIEAQGIGYKVFIPASLYSNLPATGEDVLLHTSFIVRELSQTLYGFITDSERDFFEALIGVTGIGPKLALSLIGHMSVVGLYKAISHADTAAICKVPGIGKKNSERLIIEMRDKVGSFFTTSPSDFALQTHSDTGSQKISDAMNALVNLGYNQATAQKAIKKTMKDFPEEIDLGTLITASLKNV